MPPLIHAGIAPALDLIDVESFLASIFGKVSFTHANRLNYYEELVLRTPFVGRKVEVGYRSAGRLGLVEPVAERLLGDAFLRGHFANGDILGRKQATQYCFAEFVTVSHGCQLLFCDTYMITQKLSRCTDNYPSTRGRESARD